MVLELGVLDYCRNKINSILFLCLFVDNPKKKKKVYKVLKLDELEYHRNKKKLKIKKKKQHFFIKWYSSLVYSSIVLHGTRVYQARVPHNFF